MIPPGNYLKGEPHEVHLSAAGHFMGMHYVPVGFSEKIPLARLWYRADDYAVLRQQVLDLRAEIAKLRSGGDRTATPNAILPCRIHEHDGAYKCYAHGKMWGAVSNPDEPCPGWHKNS